MITAIRVSMSVAELGVLLGVALVIGGAVGLLLGWLSGRR